jgi:hypothetical protein
VLRASSSFIPPTPTASQLLRARQHIFPFRLAFFFNVLVLHNDSLGYEALDEADLQFCIRHLWLSASRNLGKVITSAISRFPDNTLFQTIHIRLTERQSTRAAERVMENATSIVQLICAIGEMARLAGSALWKPHGSGAGRLRELLQRAVRTHEGSHSAAIWKVYIEFESKMGSTTAVKHLCYRAASVLGSCKGRLQSGSTNDRSVSAPILEFLATILYSFRTSRLAVAYGRARVADSRPLSASVRD